MNFKKIRSHSAIRKTYSTTYQKCFGGGWVPLNVIGDKFVERCKQENKGIFEKKIVENSTKGPPLPLVVEIKLLAKNDLHIMKQILYDTGSRKVARWLLKRVFKRIHDKMQI